MIGHMDRRGMLDFKYTMVEFGAGKAELSHMVCVATRQKNATLSPAVVPIKNPHFVLIDRDTFRRKADNLIRIEFHGKKQQLLQHRVDIEPMEMDTVKRIMIDIKDLNWSKMHSVIPSQCVVIGKHLCGIATDMTLRCITTSSMTPPPPPLVSPHVQAIFIALCCHQLCTLDSYISMCIIYIMCKQQ